MKPAARQAFTVTIELPAWVETEDETEAARLDLVMALCNAASRLRRGIGIRADDAHRLRTRTLVAPPVQGILYRAAMDLMPTVNDPAGVRFQGLGEICLHDGAAREVTFVIEYEPVQSNSVLDLMATALKPLERVL